MHTRYAKHWCDKIESSICENPNLSKFYGFANRKLKANFTLPYLKTESGSIVQDDEDKANLLPATFHKVFQYDNGHKLGSTVLLHNSLYLTLT